MSEDSPRSDVIFCVIMLKKSKHRKAYFLSIIEQSMTSFSFSDNKKELTFVSWQFECLNYVIPYSIREQRMPSYVLTVYLTAFIFATFQSFKFWVTVDDNAEEGLTQF